MSLPIFVRDHALHPGGLVGTARGAVPVAERSVRRRNNACITAFVPPCRAGTPPRGIPTPKKNSAFSLIEMMITVALLAFMIVGLVGMFIQTQRAFRAGLAQTDVLEAGRATTDLLTRQLEGMTPTGLGGVTNFYANISSSSPQSLLADNSVQRINSFSTFFFLTRQNLAWTGIGYLVAPQTNGVGTLYYFETNAPGSAVPDTSAFVFLDPNTAATNSSLHRVADGIVHLRVQVYSTAGQLLNTNNSQGSISIQMAAAGQNSFLFTSNAVPAYVELELGVLEHATLEKFNALPPAAQTAYLQRSQTAGHVHIFRRHIAIANVDPAAYP